MNEYADKMLVVNELPPPLRTLSTVQRYIFFEIYTRHDYFQVYKSKKK